MSNEYLETMGPYVKETIDTDKLGVEGYRFGRENNHLWLTYHSEFLYQGNSTQMVACNILTGVRTCDKECL